MTLNTAPSRIPTIKATGPPRTLQLTEYTYYRSDGTAETQSNRGT
nr:MAG TPA: hypothetical protein [Caudoviricetes sp.]